ncbi:MAG: MFS transporter [Gemmatimonadetes bacterium]|jgi:MFS family permease|nr:MFS transporter [Gemmatimonadota bacterium]
MHQRFEAFRALRNRNFALLWVGLATSGVGGQFYMIALPWLVLRLTGDPLAVGTVLAVGSVPRAAFMLFGGAVTDRLAPVRGLQWANVTGMALLCILAALVFTHSTELWAVYLIVLIAGLADGLFLPARYAVVPRLVSEESLQPANALIMGTGQVCMAVGPALAGFLIAALAGHEVASTVAGDTPGTFGIGVAFAINAVALAVFSVCLWLIRTPRPETQSQQSQGILSSALSGLGTIWQDRSVRMVMLLAATFNFFVSGPLWVGLPVLADTRFEGGAAAYGIVASAMGAGMVAGSAVAAVTRPPRQTYLGPLVIAVIFIAGMCTVGLGFVETTAAGGACTAVMGLGFGYVDVVVFTWLQRRVAKELVGRMMGFVMFAIVGMHPLSNTAAGIVLSFDTVGLFVGAGSALCILMAIYALIPTVRSLGAEM